MTKNVLLYKKGGVLMKKDDKVIINFRVEKELKELFEKRAAEKNLTLTAYIIQRCLGHLK